MDTIKIHSATSYDSKDGYLPTSDSEKHHLHSPTHQPTKPRDTRWKVAMAGTLLGALILLTYATLVTTSHHPHSALDLEPTITELSTTYAGTRETSHWLDKRWFWFLGYAAATVNFGFSLYGLASSCSGAGASTGSLVLCVYGAISTAATLGGVAYRAYQATSATWSLFNSLIRVASKRDVHHGSHGSEAHGSLGREGWRNHPLTKELNANISAAFGMPFELHGFIHKNNSRVGHMVPSGHDTWPVMAFTNYQGRQMHHVVTPMEDGKFRARIGLVQPAQSSSSKSKRDAYDDDFFSTGGLDFTSCDNTGDTDSMNDGDFNNMESELQIAIPDLTQASGFEYQIYDRDYQGTLGSGSVSAVDGDGNTGIDDMPMCPSGLAQLDQDYEYSSGYRRRRLARAARRARR